MTLSDVANYTPPKPTRDPTPPKLVYDGRRKPAVRSTDDPQAVRAHSTVGLYKLRLIATHQFSEDGLKEIVAELPRDASITVFDFRQETHAFINGEPVSWRLEPRNWSNAGQSREHLLDDQKEKLDELRLTTDGRLEVFTAKDVKNGTNEQPTLTVEVVSAVLATEKEVAHLNRCKYVWAPTLDHCRADNDVVDYVVAEWRKLASDPNSYVIFHCLGGMGRTTFWATIFDMLHNAIDLKIDQIIGRQNELKGKPTDVKGEKAYKIPLVEEKDAFLTVFYQYSRDHPIGSESPLGWLDWIQKKISERNL